MENEILPLSSLPVEIGIQISIYAMPWLKISPAFAFSVAWQWTYGVIRNEYNKVRDMQD